MGGGQSKSRTIAETLNNKINNIVNTSVNNMQTISQSGQRIVVKCTKEQQELSNKTYDLLYNQYTQALNSYYKYGSKGSPPIVPQPVGCYAVNLKQKATIITNVSSGSKDKLESEIAQKLQNESELLSNADIELPAIGYSQTEIDAINKITNNITNNSYSNVLRETINKAISEQEIIVDGTTIIGAEQTNAVSLIASSLFESLTQGVDQSVIRNSSETIAVMKQTSGLTNITKGFFNMIGGIFQGFQMIIILGILALCFLVYLVGPCSLPIPGISSFCIKKNKKNRKQKLDDDENGD